MKIIKRSGIEVDFDASKIDSAVSKANREAAENARLTVEQIKDISKYIKDGRNTVTFYYRKNFKR